MPTLQIVRVSGDSGMGRQEAWGWGSHTQDLYLYSRHGGPCPCEAKTYLLPLTRVLSVGWRVSAWLALGCNQSWGLLHWILASELYRERPFYPHLAIEHCLNPDTCEPLHFLHHNRTLASGFPGTGCCMPDMVQLSAGRQISLPGL